VKTIEEAILAASRCLAGVGIDNPTLESEHLIAAYLRVSRTRLVLNRRQVLPNSQIRMLRTWLHEREKRKPLAYIAGEQPFRDFNVKVNSSVLVPRPETELLVEQAFRVLDHAKGSITAVDVGTGSGNIALSLAMHPKIELVIGIDRSSAALKVAHQNQIGIRRGAPVRWMKGDLLNPVMNENDPIALIVANLPYVRTGEMHELEPELNWEPRMALDGGEDGLRVIEPCIHQASRVLAPGGTLLLEIGAEQSQQVRLLLEQASVWEDIRIFCDLAGLPRIAQARRRGK
jgi:release factor glutamine methyltransferase